MKLNIQKELLVEGYRGLNNFFQRNPHHILYRKPSQHNNTFAHLQQSLNQHKHTLILNPPPYQIEHH